MSSRSRRTPWFRPTADETAHTETDYLRQELVRALAEDAARRLTEPPSPEPLRRSWSNDLDIYQAALHERLRGVEAQLRASWGLG